MGALRRTVQARPPGVSDPHLPALRGSSPTAISSNDTYLFGQLLDLCTSMLDICVRHRVLPRSAPLRQAACACPPPTLHWPLSACPCSKVVAACCCSPVEQ